MNGKMLVYLALLVGAGTWTLYTWRNSQPPDQGQIERCNELVRGMPENTREEIDRSISRFVDCLDE